MPPTGPRMGGHQQQDEQGNGTKNQRVAKMKPMKGEKLQMAMLKMLLICSQGVRELRGVIFLCFIIQKESEEHKKMKEQLQAYAGDTQELGKGHGLGPPCLFAFGGLLLALHERGISVGAVTAEKVKEAHMKWAELDTETAFDLVPHCKLRKCYDGTLCKLEIVTRTSSFARC